MGNNHIGKYLIALVKGDNTKIIRAFDNREDALIYGESEHDKYTNLRKGVFCCIYRRKRENFTDEECTYFGMSPYEDDVIESWIDIDDLLNDIQDRERERQKLKRRRKKERMRNN